LSFLNKIKPNKPIVGLEGYFITILGKSKFGKTTFVYDLVKEYYKGEMDKALLLAPEIGYKALDGIHALPISDFDSTSDEEKEQMGVYGFIETVDDLIENKSEIPYRMIIIDTITALEDLATKYILKREGRKAGEKYSSIGDIAFGKGYTLLAEELYSQIDRLKKSGFSTIIIGHEKTKQIEQKNGKTYNLITLNCQGKTTDIIEREADLIIYGDLVTDVKGDNVKQERLLRFRSDGNIVCGSRFRNIPDYIELDAKLFIETFKQAVLDSFINDVNEKDIDKIAKEQQEDRDKKSKLYTDGNESNSVDDIVEKIDGVINALKGASKTKAKKVIKELNNDDHNYRKIDDVQILNEILKGISEL
jgi:hypothetical protein